jgi:hypothetical protein
MAGSRIQMQTHDASVEEAFPVRGNSASRSGHGLVQRVVLRVCQARAIEELAGAVVVEPVLAGFESTDDWVAGRFGMGGSVLAGRVVATTDMSALSATSKVQPPTAGLEALDAPGTARSHSLDDGSISHRRKIPQGRRGATARPPAVAPRRSRRPPAIFSLAAWFDRASGERPSEPNR